MLSAPADHSEPAASCVFESQVFSPLVSHTCCGMARCITNLHAPGEAQRRSPLGNFSQVIVTQPHSSCTNPERLRDLMLRVDEGLITTVNAQSAWLVRFAFRFLRAMLLSYVRAVVFDRGMLAK
jgi:hypothetical protein